MRAIGADEVWGRLVLDNPWWTDGAVPLDGRRLRPGPLAPFAALVEDVSVRCVRLTGPRAAGKTTLLLQTVDRLIADGHPRASIVYLSCATPTYAGLRLASLLDRVVAAHGLPRLKPIFLLLDDSEAMPDWPLQVRTIANRMPALTCIASVSVEAAPRQPVPALLAGDMEIFHLPPPGFAETLSIRRAGRRPLIAHDPNANQIAVAAMDSLNEAFLDWACGGGLGLAAFGQGGGRPVSALLGNGMIERILWPDIPAAFGIGNPADLFRVFAMLALNSGEEVSLESIATATGAAKNTIRKYLDYLEAAWLLTRVDKIDLDNGVFERARSFKVYLNDPALRSLLAGPPAPESPGMARAVENAVFAAWRGRNPEGRVYFARRRGRDIPFVSAPPPEAPEQGYGLFYVDWSDDPPAPGDLKLPAPGEAPLVAQAEIFTRGLAQTSAEGADPRIVYTPAAVYCWDTGRWDA
ncbi:MAG: ATP-binding protein [Alphaproteobacteria bacterium]